MSASQRQKHNPLVPELGVTNYSNSLEFYTETLGFNIIYRREEEGFAFLEREGAQLMIDDLNVGRSFIKEEGNPKLGHGINLQIETSNIEKLHQNILRNSATIYLEMEEKWYRKDDIELGNKQFIVEDPDGYLLRFFQEMGARTIKGNDYAS